MTAAAITPSVVQKSIKGYTNSTGTPVRLVEYFVKGTKANQSDWIVTATYCPGTFLWAYGTTIDSSGDGTAEACTYTATGTKLVLPGASAGTSYIKVVCQVT
jgi:hypothetical protein